MPVLSSIFLVLALVLAVVIGPQTRPWSWGPAMLALSAATIAALPSFLRKGNHPSDFGLIALGASTAGWFALRSWGSPISELGQADLLLVCGAVGAFVSVRSFTGNVTAERIFAWGIALLLLASVLVIGKQMIEPGFSPLFRTRDGSRMISGFSAHYNEAANFLIASSMMVAGAALFGRHATAVRLLWLVIALAGLAAVWFTRSRGGIFGAAVAGGVFLVFALTISGRRKDKWFAPCLVAIPIIALGIGAFLWMGWQNAQELRRAGTGFEEMVDNSCRLYFLGIALSIIGLHPMSGGGSRSFSWECFRFADAKGQGDILTHRPEFVHNELVQAATDYGLIGAGLLIGLIGALTLAVVLRFFFEEIPKNRDARDGWRIGAIAALAGMLVQSSFSFVFHLLPGVLLLGICLGKMSRSESGSSSPQTIGTRAILTIAAVLCAALLLPFGWKGSRVTKILWPTHISKGADSSAEARIESLTEAIRIWPQASLYQERAIHFQSLAGPEGQPGFFEPAEKAIADYHEAADFHPFDPSIAINRANLLSQLKRDAEAEEWFARGIGLQGGMEPAFRGHFSLANHYLRKSLRLFDPSQPEPALEALEQSADQMETAAKRMHWVISDMLEPRISIHESLGAAREAVGDRDGALASYDFASTLQNGARAHYRAGVLIGKMAVEAWSQRRPAEAMKHFMEAKRRVSQAKGLLPQGVTPSQSVEYNAYLDETIAFLKGAKVEPSK
jgi:hypothetical protein